jgi:hypothetical protein
MNSANMGTDRNEFDGINLKKEYTKELEKLGSSKGFDGTSEMGSTLRSSKGFLKLKRLSQI